MPGRGSYGPGGKWIHDRAHRIMEKNPDADKGMAYAIATQQGHKVGKSPKGFRTKEGVREAKHKFSGPKKEYQKTASWLGRAVLPSMGALAGAPIGAAVGAARAEEGERWKGALRGAGKGAVIGGIAGGAADLGGMAGKHLGRALTKGTGRVATRGGRLVDVAGIADDAGTLLGAGGGLAAGGLLMRKRKEKVAATTGWVGPIEKLTEDNKAFRKVLFTGKHSQLVLMSIPVGGDIGEETHPAVDQFFRIDGGEGAVIMNGQRHAIKDGDAFVVPAGTRHNVVNTSKSEPLQLYSVYSPPNHQPGVLHETKEDAMRAEEEGTDKKPSAASIVPGKEKRANGEEEGEEEEGGEEASAPGKLVPKKVLEEFFRKNPAPPDDKVHDLAESYGASPHNVEAQIYEMLGSRMKKEGGISLDSFFGEFQRLQ
jgi:mannose-6-phosphate isomerase-like protein (cupin superfamily)